jgi:acetyl-CoA carboxylase biotin carboxylase subunit
VFKRVLIANRGEIAVRVIRACRDLGVETVAVFSDADRTALHVQLADHAVRVGRPPSTESYLSIDAILAAAERSGAEAVHPGYGFLAENAEFARRLTAAGLAFIGPSPEAIEQMGDKAEARRLMRAAGVPVVPGSEGILSSEDEVLAVARDIGFPLMLKAAAGGGGKGMRLVDAEGELLSALRAVRSEARSSFGDDRLYAERYVTKPRHIEIQLLADMHGNVVHLYDRECSIQRRHQKVIEEAPSPVLREDVRAAMGEVAVRAARAIDYTGAGTIEFLLDAEQNFYFMEMNTRIQVEHPITEAITDVDLVKSQIAVAAGEPLPFGQEQVRRRGHAIECRIYAEDPYRGFLPSPGRINHLHLPGGRGIRVDSGVYRGGEVSPFYDPMIAKIVSWAKTREEAINRMRRAVEECQIGGPATNLAFHRWLLAHPRFARGDFDTNLIQEEMAGFTGAPANVELEDAAVVAALCFKRLRNREVRVRSRGQISGSLSPWVLTARKSRLGR